MAPARILPTGSIWVGTRSYWHGRAAVSLRARNSPGRLVPPPKTHGIQQTAFFISSFLLFLGRSEDMWGGIEQLAVITKMITTSRVHSTFFFS